MNKEAIAQAIDNLKFEGFETNEKELETAVNAALSLQAVKDAYDVVKLEYARDQEDEELEPSFEYENARCELSCLINEGILNALGLDSESDEYAMAVHDLVDAVNPHTQN